MKHIKYMLKIIIQMILVRLVYSERKRDKQIYVLFKLMECSGIHLCQDAFLFDHAIDFTIERHTKTKTSISKTKRKMSPANCICLTKIRIIPVMELNEIVEKSQRLVIIITISTFKIN